jgi:hypothetical protein
VEWDELIPIPSRGMCGEHWQAVTYGLAYRILQFIWDPGCQPGGGLNLVKTAGHSDREVERPCMGTHNKGETETNTQLLVSVHITRARLFEINQGC